jgi:hypothetical protein
MYRMILNYRALVVFFAMEQVDSSAANKLDRFWAFHLASIEAFNILKSDDKLPNVSILSTLRRFIEDSV